MERKEPTKRQALPKLHLKEIENETLKHALTELHSGKQATSWHVRPDTPDNVKRDALYRIHDTMGWPIKEDLVKAIPHLLEISKGPHSDSIKRGIADAIVRIARTHPEETGKIALELARAELTPEFSIEGHKQNLKGRVREGGTDLTRDKYTPHAFYPLDRTGINEPLHDPNQPLVQETVARLILEVAGHIPTEQEKYREPWEAHLPKVTEHPKQEITELLKTSIAKNKAEAIRKLESEKS